MPQHSQQDDAAFANFDENIFKSFKKEMLPNIFQKYVLVFEIKFGSFSTYISSVKGSRCTEGKIF